MPTTQPEKTYPYRDSLTEAQVWGLLRLRNINWEEVSFVKANRTGEQVTVKVYPKCPAEFVRSYTLTWMGKDGLS